MQFSFAPLISNLHRRLVHRGRAEAISDHLSAMIPRDAMVLDVGCGDGLVDRLIFERRPDLMIQGIDSFPRAGAQIAVLPFDGENIPYRNKSFDGVMFIDVLHHAANALLLLREAVRVSRRCILIKDHNADGFGARPILRLMDFAGNVGNAYAWSGDYWPARRWRETFEELQLCVAENRTQLGLYRAPASWIFERSYHFIARLDLDRE